MDYQSQNIAQGSITVLIATIITTKLLARCELNNTFYGIVYMTMIQIVDYFKNLMMDNEVRAYIKAFVFNIYQNGSFYSKGLILVPLLLLCVCIYKSNGLSVWIKYLFRKFQNEKKYKELTLYDVTKTMDIATYMNRYPDFFKGYDEVKRSDSSILQSLMGNVYKTSDTSRWLTRLNVTTVPIVNQEIIVNDTKYNVKGFIIWYDNQLATTEYGSSKDDKTVHKVNFKYVKITLDVSSPALIEKYIEDISRTVNKEINESFIAAKLMSCESSYEYEMATKTIGYMKDYCIDNMEKIFIETFFHPEKDTLWKYLKKIKLDPNYFYKYGQIPQMNLLLHGPPGTGKSSFSYRVARTLGRNIITVDLRMIKKKSMLYSIMEKPIIEGRLYSPAQIVYVFDEFDMTVKYLHAQQVKKNNEEKMWKNRIEGYYHSYDSNLPTATTNRGKYSSTLKLTNGRNYDSDSDSNSTSTSSESSVSDSDTDVNSDNVHVDGISKMLTDSNKLIKRKKNKKEKRKNKKKKKKIKKDNTEKELNYSIPDNISLQDLLEILQGPVPVEQRIIIATTNDYEGIKDLCPALFRSGRLTPILFDNPSKQVIEEIVLHYFKKKVDFYIPNKIERPTSEIIDLCLKAHTFDNPYEYFKGNLKNVIKEIAEA